MIGLKSRQLAHVRWAISNKDDSLLPQADRESSLTGAFPIVAEPDLPVRLRQRLGLF